jgi:hypothetical protein
VTIGMTGETSTPTGTPAALSRRIASMRRCGAEARGSSLADSRLSRLVTETSTATSRVARQRRLSRSMSRSTIALLVMIVQGWRASSSTSSSSRVMR